MSLRNGMVHGNHDQFWHIETVNIRENDTRTRFDFIEGTNNKVPVEGKISRRIEKVRQPGWKPFFH